MKKTNVGLMVISLLIVCALTLNLVGCSMEVQAEDLTEGITPKRVTELDDLSSRNEAVTDFSIRLFKASEESGKNTLISPLSILCALAMTANGAEEETLRQMEDVMGMTAEDLNLYLYSYLKKLPQGEKYKLFLANSIWFADAEGFAVDHDFLQTNANYYGADIFKAPFNGQTKKDINNWVKRNTDGMIPEILDRIPEAAVMYLVNALAFEAEWSKIYERDQVSEGVFTKEDNTKQNVDFMYGVEQNYLEDDNAKGFIKLYSGGKYAFVAMLPDEGVSVSEYVASLNGESLSALLAESRQEMIYTSIPKFEADYSVEMSDILKSMGMTDAFDAGKADFRGIGSTAVGNTYISRVLHKTFISVGEKGTKAGAATLVETKAEGECVDPIAPKEIYLDRPFVYMLIDCENNIPFFIGTMMGIE